MWRARGVEPGHIEVSLDHLCWIILSASTTLRLHSHVHAVEAFASYFQRSPHQLGPDHIRECQVHLLRDVQQGRGDRDRDKLLSSKLLGVLREYRYWMKSKTYLYRAWRTTGEPMFRSREGSLNRG